VYAPGFYTGYGVKTVPGVRESIEQGNWVEARRQIEIFGELTRAVAAKIRAAEKELRARI
jgi:N-acetylated-alpha-linked acidic dipeptidase